MSESLAVLSQSLQDGWASFLTTLPRVVVALGVLLFCMALGRWVTKWVPRAFGKVGSFGGHSPFFGHVTNAVFLLIGVFLGLHVMGWTGVATGLLATGGLMAVVFGFAFREIGENLLAGLLLAASRPFDVGDVVESNGHRGVVKAIELRHVQVRTPDGCDVFIPSAAVFRNPLLNFTRDRLRRFSFEVGIDYGDDPREARRVLQRAISTTEEVLEEPPPAVQLSGFTPQYVELRVTGWASVAASGAGLEAARTAAMCRCWEALKEGGFTFSSNVVSAVELMGGADGAS